jgi:hypothetical protein
VYGLCGRLALAVCLALGAVALLSACSSGSSTPSNSAALLTTAAGKLDGDTAFHFLMSENHQGTPTGTDFDIIRAEGDVQRPDKLSASATVADGELSGAQAQVQLIVIGDQAWYTNPLTGKFERADQYTGIRTFFDPQHGLATALGAVTSMSNPVDSSVTSADGTITCWKITGTVSSDKLASLTGAPVPPGQQIPASVWIGQYDGQIRQVQVSGKLTSFDTDQTTRTIVLSKFNESVNIQPPATGS